MTCRLSYLLEVIKFHIRMVVKLEISRLKN